MVRTEVQLKVQQLYFNRGVLILLNIRSTFKRKRFECSYFQSMLLYGRYFTIKKYEKSLKMWAWLAKALPRALIWHKTPVFRRIEGAFLNDTSVNVFFYLKITQTSTNVNQFVCNIRHLVNNLYFTWFLICFVCLFVCLFFQTSSHFQPIF